MRGVNRVILIGRLGKDPETRQLPGGGSVCNFSLATSENWKDKQTGEAKEKTEWHRVVIFGKLGDIAGQYLKKGSEVYIEGKLQTRKWTDKEGKDQYTTEIHAHEMQMIGGRDTSGQAAPSAPQAAAFHDDEIPF